MYIYIEIVRRSARIFSAVKEALVIKNKQKPRLFRYLGSCLGTYRRWTIAAVFFGCAEVMLEIFIPILMSVIVDGGLYREEDFMLRSLFPESLIANRDRFVLVVGAGMVLTACISMACTGHFFAHSPQPMQLSST